jgi:hypothetical protein
MPGWKQDVRVRQLYYSGVQSANSLLEFLGAAKRFTAPDVDRLAAITRDAPRLARKAPRSGRRMLFVSMRSATAHNVLDATLMHALTLRGVQSRGVLSGGLLPACDCRTVLNDRPGYCASCDRWARAYFRNARIPFDALPDVVSPEEADRARTFAAGFGVEDFTAAEFDGYAVGTIAHASVLRHLLRGSLIDDEHTRRVVRDYLAAAVINVIGARRLLERDRPDTVISSHGYYVTWGPFCEVARRMGIPFYVYAYGYRINTLVITGGGNFWDVLLAEPEEVWGRSIRTDADRAEITAYLESRKEGTKDIIQYNPGAIEDRARVLRELDLDPARPIYGMFTNLGWDGAVIGRNIAFADMNEWVVATIRHFAARPDKQLVIRAHPAEVLLRNIETQEKVREVIDRAFDRLPANVRFVPPDSKLSSYTLGSLLSAGIVYTTKMGLELALRGLPIILGGEAFYMDKGFTYESRSAEAYFRHLDDPAVARPLSDAQRERALNYAHYYFFRRLVPFPLFDPKTYAPTWDRVAELAPGVTPELDAVCDAILAGRECIR